MKSSLDFFLLDNFFLRICSRYKNALRCDFRFILLENRPNFYLNYKKRCDFYDDNEFNVAKTTIYSDDWLPYINIEIQPQTIKGQFIKQSTLKKQTRNSIEKKKLISTTKKWQEFEDQFLYVTAAEWQSRKYTEVSFTLWYYFLPRQLR